MDDPVKFDLHMHSVCSDGTDRPAEVVCKARQAGVTLMALTDHDGVSGVLEAVEAGAPCGVTVLPAVEMDTEWPGEMHILGLDLNIDEPRFAAMLETARTRRVARNGVILDKLKAAGLDIGAHLTRPLSTTTRLHLALALVEAGFAGNVREAFDRYLRRGCVGYYTVQRFLPEEVVSAILQAGGVPVWAHPFHGGQNIYRMLEMLKLAGILGIEAYHPSASAGESATLISLARQNGLLVTCGSDSHGANRPGVTIGCTWRDTPELAQTAAFFLARQKNA